MVSRLNPLPVNSSGGPTPTPPALAGEDGFALVWTVVIALTPLICDYVITAVVGARPLSSVGLFHIGLSLFGLTLAAVVRVLTHGRGRSIVPILFVIAVLEVLTALYFGGTFSQHAVDVSHIGRDLTVLQADPHGASLSYTTLERINEDLTAVRDSEPEATTVGYVLMVVCGLFSIIVLVRFWGGPTAPERLEAKKESGRGAA